MTLLQITTLLIPIAAASTVGLLTYFFAIKSKKFDLLYASKIPAFTEISSKLTKFKSSCFGKVAEYRGMDFSPYAYSGSTLAHLREIVEVVDANIIFLSKSNRNKIEQLLSQMGMACNLELRLAADKNDSADYSEVYQKLGHETEKLIELLYKDLNLK
ncbi:hypothetical protein ASE92_17265 [Pedobacter sp. Leaf41]|uniref:hypothetical protein n=1 Tax=Pedobacter sp. Leaf41 TaxID=1736218 RepID=UPI000702F52A|nr:hypothetical protein [Pedobacter sp. Leaf41]KQN32356.1 hypothetical protein ASE92_17265 [Pedobacter sp. Leaf41]